ncbi:MAG: inorganic diphosphatase [Candidatus Dormiibacterota bacterium]
MEIFFETYKQLEDDKEVAVGRWEGRTAALAAIEVCRRRAGLASPGPAETV